MPIWKYNWRWILLKSARWVKGYWGPSLQGTKSSLLQGMVPFVGLLHVFGNELANSRIQLECADGEVARVLTCQTYKDALVMQVIRKWVLSLLSHNIYVTFVASKSSHSDLALSLLSFQVPNGLAGTRDLDPQPTQLLPQDWPMGCLARLPNSYILPCPQPHGKYTLRHGKCSLSSIRKLSTLSPPCQFPPHPFSSLLPTWKLRTYHATRLVHTCQP